MILEIVVHDANIQDRDGAKQVLEGILERFPRLVKVVADGGYAGRLVDWVQEKLNTPLEIVKRTDPGFKVLPKRWIVERTFGWLMKNRRLCRDYERDDKTVRYWIQLAMIRLMTRRIVELSKNPSA